MTEADLEWDYVMVVDQSAAPVPMPVGHRAVWEIDGKLVNSRAIVAVVRLVEVLKKGAAEKPSDQRPYFEWTAAWFDETRLTTGYDSLSNGHPSYIDSPDEAVS